MQYAYRFSVMLPCSGKCKHHKTFETILEQEEYYRICDLSLFFWHFNWIKEHWKTHAVLLLQHLLIKEHQETPRTNVTREWKFNCTKQILKISASFSSFIIDKRLLTHSTLHLVNHSSQRTTCHVVQVPTVCPFSWALILETCVFFFSNMTLYSTDILSIWTLNSP